MTDEVKAAKIDSLALFALLVGGVILVAVLMYLAGVNDEQHRWRKKAVECNCGEYRLSAKTGEIRWTWIDRSAFRDD